MLSESTGIVIAKDDPCGCLFPQSSGTMTTREKLYCSLLATALHADIAGLERLGEHLRQVAEECKPDAHYQGARSDPSEAQA